MHGMETTDATLYLVVAEADTSATGFSDAGLHPTRPLLLPLGFGRICLMIVSYAGIRGGSDFRGMALQ